jgi:hypothetical protein
VKEEQALWGNREKEKDIGRFYGKLNISLRGEK